MVRSCTSRAREFKKERGMEDLEKRKKYRATARDRAGVFSRKLADAAAAGKDIHQLSIDLSDEDLVFAAGLPEEDRELYEELYAQELNALTAATNAEAARIEQETLQTQIQTAQTSFAWLWGVLAFLAFLVVFLAR